MLQFESLNILIVVSIRLKFAYIQRIECIVWQTKPKRKRKEYEGHLLQASLDTLSWREDEGAVVFCEDETAGAGAGIDTVAGAGAGAGVDTGVVSLLVASSPILSSKTLRATCLLLSAAFLVSGS